MEAPAAWQVPFHLKLLKHYWASKASPRPNGQNQPALLTVLFYCVTVGSLSWGCVDTEERCSEHLQLLWQCWNITDITAVIRLLLWEKKQWTNINWPEFVYILTVPWGWFLFWWQADLLIYAISSKSLCIYMVSWRWILTFLVTSSHFLYCSATIRPKSKIDCHKILIGHFVDESEWLKWSS